MDLKFDITNQIIKRIDTQKVVADSKNYLFAKFQFTPDWDGVRKTASFVHNKIAYAVILDDNDSCKVPWEVIKADAFTVSVFGGDLITVNTELVRVFKSGLREDGLIPGEPTPSLYEQLLALVNTKQDKLIAGENITITEDSVISAQSEWEKGTGIGSIVSRSNASQGGQAIGDFSVSEGFGSDAKGNYSHAEGQLTTTNGDCAHAEGQGTTAQGNCSHAEGIDTIAQNQSEHAEGQYNKSHKASTTFGDVGNTIHSVGIGTGAGSLEEQDRRNAIEIMQSGDIYIDGVGNYDGANFEVADTLQEVINNKQEKLTAGTNITIDDDNVISATVPELSAELPIEIVDDKIKLRYDNETIQVNEQGQLHSKGSKNIISLTQEEFDALPEKDPDTLYIIKVPFVNFAKVEVTGDRKGFKIPIDTEIFTVTYDYVEDIWE